MQAGWVGVPIDGVETRLRDEHGAPVPHDGESVGSLEVPADLLHRLPGRPGRAPRSGPTTAGSAPATACIAADGRHRIVGRASVDLIKSGGYRIGAGEIESTLLGHAAVAECAVVGAPDEDLGQRIVAYVVARTPVADEPGLGRSMTVIAWVGAELSAHKRPRECASSPHSPATRWGRCRRPD